MSEFISPPELEISQTLKYQEYIPNKISVSGKEIDGQIRLDGKEIKGRTGDTVIYFGGTFENPDSKSTKDLKQSWADYSGNTCYSFSATANPEEVLKFIEEKGLTNIVLAGYSQGTMRAIEVAKKLEENGKTTNGLILLEPTSLYEQKNLPKKFISEIFDMVKIQEQYKKSKLNKKYKKEKLLEQRNHLIAEGINIGIPKLVGIKNKNEPSLYRQIKNMSSVHQDLSKIKSQIVIVQGKRDDVSNPGEIDLTIFSKSDKVDQITVESFGTHFGPMFRSEQMAKVGLWQLHRQAA